MARPTKIGLEYFPMDVDIFEDEKTIPVSSEFGPKGECIIVRVLCAIYRNGYFAECSDAFKFKIAKQANLPNSLVSEVITRLVKWGFFDKAVFDSFGVLTSTGIQKRWKEATRKRVSKNELDYWILESPEQKQGFPAEENPLSRSESTQSKVNESKVYKSKDNSIINPEVLERIEERKDRSISDCRDLFLSDKEHLNLLSNTFGFKNIDETKEVINEFFKSIELRGERKKTILEAKSHFTNWQIKRQNGERQKTSVYEA